MSTNGSRDHHVEGMNHRVLICGYYGFANAGDEAILSAMLAALRKREPGVEVTVLSGAPDETRRTHAVGAVYWIDIPAIIEAIRATDLVVLGGGGLFHDYWGVAPSGILTHTHTGIAYWSGIPILAALAGKPCQIWGVGVGPLETTDGRELTRLSFQLAAHASVRDDASRALLTELGVEPDTVQVTADPVWMLRRVDGRRGRRILARSGVQHAGTLLGVAIRPWLQDAARDMWFGALANGLDAFLQNGDDRRVLFLPFQRLAEADVDDRAAVARVREAMRHASRAHVLDRELAMAELQALLAGCDVVLAMRLHAAVLAASSGVPIVALSYDAKVRAAMEQLGVAQLTLEVSPSELTGLEAMLERVLLDRPHLSASLARAARGLADRAAADADAAVALLARPALGKIPADAGRWILGALETQARRVAGLPAAAPVADEAVTGLQQEISELRLQNESLRRELDVWKRSRLWRTADLYWRTRRAFGFDTPSTIEPAAPAPPEPTSVPAPHPVAEPAAVTTSGNEALRPAATIPEDFPAVPSGAYDVVVLSIIDWDFRFQRPQQLATQFARHGHRVLYLSTTRFLPPDGLPWMLETKTERVAELSLAAPSALDIYGGELDDDALNLVEDDLHEVAFDLALGDTVCIVQVPFWTPLAERLRAHLGWHVVYDCMDEWTSFPGFGDHVLSLERQLVERADVTVVSASRLEEKWRGAARRLVLARNGVDLEHYQRYYGPNGLLADVTHPVIGYYGALASWVDVALLEKVAAAFPDATMVLAGGRFDVDLAPLESLPNVRLLGQRPYAEMPQLLWHFDVCLIPFVVNEITEATNPVKFYEYLCGGKPVVAPPLTELLPFRDLCYLAAGHEATVEAIRRALAESPGDPRREARKREAAANDWSGRYALIHEAVRAGFPLISVVVVTHGGLELTRACIESLLGGETWPNLEVIVVDNGSPDRTADWVRQRAEADARLRLIENPVNRGFPAANNQGIAGSAGEVVVLLNNDTVVPPGLLGRLAAHLKDPRIGLVCPTTNFCGNEARVEAPYADLRDLPRAAADRNARFAGRRFDLSVAAMYCLAARREVLGRVGPLDESFGIGMFEDDDYSERVRALGLRVVCAEDAYVHHVGQGAFRHLPDEVYKALWRQNQEYYERKWNRKWQPHNTRAGVAAASSAFKGP